MERAMRKQRKQKKQKNLEEGEITGLAGKKRK
jgi:hypothetical protein